MNRNLKAIGITLALIVLVATAIAAVPGIFSSVNATLGYQVNGAAGASGQALCSDGTRYDVPCSVIGSAFYQTTTGTSGDKPQRGKLGFSANFALTDLSGFNETEIDLTTTGVTPGTYSCANVTVDSFGRVTSLTNGSCGGVTQSLIIPQGSCTTSNASEVFCSAGTFTWATAFADTAYAVTCTYATAPTGTGSHPGDYGPYVTSKFTTGVTVEIQSGSNSAGGANPSPEIDCIAVHP